MKIKNILKNIVISAAAYAVYVAITTMSRGYITPVTALGDLIFPVAVFAALEAAEERNEEHDVG